MMDMAALDLQQAAPALGRVCDTKPVLSIVGLGSVGAVSTACFASLGHRVVAADIDRTKCEQVARGDSPLDDEDVNDLLSEGVANGLISTTDDVAFAVRATDVTFVTVGAPTTADGGCDYRSIQAAARSIGVGIAQKGGFHVVVMRCRAPHGPAVNVLARTIEKISAKKLGLDFGIAFSPVFFCESMVVADFFEPPKTVFGATDVRTARFVARIFEPVDNDIVTTSIETAEMIQNLDDVWQAAKACVAHEMGRLCEPLGVNRQQILDSFAQDAKLEPNLIETGTVSEASNLSKKVSMLARVGEQFGITTPMIRALAQRSGRDEQAGLRHSDARLAKAFRPLRLPSKTD